MKGSKEGIRQIVEEFAQKHLREPVKEDEKLELDVGYHWRNRNATQGETEQEAKSATSRPQTDRDACQYFSLASLFFSELTNEPALDIDILDTIFFQPDHSVCYLYRDARKGLTRTRQRGINACETFLKRKARKRDLLSNKERLARKQRPAVGEERSEKSIREELGYIALLRYKDGSFLRLRESDLRAIFTNPLYANEKFRHHNCTQYIQALPQEGADEFRVHFSWQKYREEPLAKAAASYQLGRSEFGERASVRRELQELDPLAFLYFTIFEICSFVCIHYNRRVESAAFHFVREGEGWALAGVEGARVTQLEQKEFMRGNLWEEGRKVSFGQLREEKEIFRLKEEAKSQFYRKVEGFFEETNSAIRKDMLQFVQAKVDNVKRSSDKLLSRSIFSLLHPQHPKVNLYDLLDSPQHLARLIAPSPPPPKRPKELPVAPPVKRVARRGRRHLQEQLVYRGIESVRAELSEFLE